MTLAYPWKNDKSLHRFLCKRRDSSISNQSAQEVLRLNSPDLLYAIDMTMLLIVQYQHEAVESSTLLLRLAS